MNIDKINVYRVTLPFAGDFSISRLQGLFSTRVIVEIIAEGGTIQGYGEGVPIAFVTGETPESTVQNTTSLVASARFPWQLDHVSEVWDFVDSLFMGKECHAAICAVEMALLDALGKSQNTAVVDYFPKDFHTPRIRYGASITLGDRGRITQLCSMIKSLGINHLRIKMGHEFEQNKAAMDIVGDMFDNGCELRIDPNGVWDYGLALQHIPLVDKYGVKVVEEPMVRHEPGFAEFARILYSKGVLLMACESAPTLDDVERIAQEGHYNMVNVKLCRSGGFRRTFRLIDRLRQHKIAFQIGCSLGEAGLLSAAGRTLGLLCKDALYYDGSYDAFLLKENITVEDVTFGPGGEAGPLPGPGLGVAVNREKLERLSDPSSRITIKRP